MSTPSPNQPQNLFPNTPNDQNEDPNPPPSDTSVEPSPITVLNHRQNASSSTPNSGLAIMIASELEKNLLNAYMHEVWLDGDATTRMNEINNPNALALAIIGTRNR